MGWCLRSACGAQHERRFQWKFACRERHELVHWISMEGQRQRQAGLVEWHVWQRRPWCTRGGGRSGWRHRSELAQQGLIVVDRAVQELSRPLVGHLHSMMSIRGVRTVVDPSTRQSKSHADVGKKK